MSGEIHWTGAGELGIRLQEKLPVLDSPQGLFYHFSISKGWVALCCAPGVLQNLIRGASISTGCAQGVS
jgi:hypothetical protein